MLKVIRNLKTTLWSAPAVAMMAAYPPILCGRMLRHP
jgi:hypothetical protein